MFGAVAIGLLTYLCYPAHRLYSLVAARLLLSFSYTFWSQAIIAEVYTLHMALVLRDCIALHAYAERPSRVHLGNLFGVYSWRSAIICR